MLLPPPSSDFRPEEPAPQTHARGVNAEALVFGATSRVAQRSATHRPRSAPTRVPPQAPAPAWARRQSRRRGRASAQASAITAAAQPGRGECEPEGVFARRERASARPACVRRRALSSCAARRAPRASGHRSGACAQTHRRGRRQQNRQRQRQLAPRAPHRAQAARRRPAWPAAGGGREPAGQLRGDNRQQGTNDEGAAVAHNEGGRGVVPPRLPCGTRAHVIYTHASCVPVLLRHAAAVTRLRVLSRRWTDACCHAPACAALGLPVFRVRARCLGHATRDAAHRGHRA
jgi:hypothetical protein